MMRRRGIGKIAGIGSVLITESALDNVAIGPLAVRRMSDGDARKRASALLDNVGLADESQSYPANLSGGQQERVAIARTLAMEPEVMLFEMTFARRVADWVVVFERGAIVEHGPPARIFDAPQVDRTREFLSHLGWTG